MTRPHEKSSENIHSRFLVMCEVPHILKEKKKELPSLALVIVQNQCNGVPQGSCVGLGLFPKGKMNSPHQFFDRVVFHLFTVIFYIFP